MCDSRRCRGISDIEFVFVFSCMLVCRKVHTHGAVTHVQVNSLCKVLCKIIKKKAQYKDGESNTIVTTLKLKNLHRRDKDKKPSAQPHCVHCMCRPCKATKGALLLLPHTHQRNTHASRHLHTKLIIGCISQEKLTVKCVFTFCS